MNAGLPGTGLGGIFYLLLALAMPVREIYLTARGRSSRERWRVVLRQLTLALGIVATVAASVWVLGRTLPDDLGRTTGQIGVAAPVVTAAVLVVLTLVVRVWALLDASTRRARGAR